MSDQYQGHAEKLLKLVQYVNNLMFKLINGKRGMLTMVCNCCVLGVEKN